MPLPERRCSTCSHWDAPPTPGDVIGVCRRNAPAPLLWLDTIAGAGKAGQSAYPVWPATAADEWCGQWQPPAVQQTIEVRTPAAAAGEAAPVAEAKG